MHLGGDWVDTKRQRWDASRWVPEEEGALRSLSTITIAAENFNANGVSSGALVRTIAKAFLLLLLNIMFVVGRQAVSVSSCTHNNLYLPKQTYAERTKRPCCTWTHLRSGIPTNAD